MSLCRVFNSVVMSLAAVIVLANDGICVQKLGKCARMSYLRFVNVKKRLANLKKGIAFLQFDWWVGKITSERSKQYFTGIPLCFHNL
jgi:hypothetical protein